MFGSLSVLNISDPDLKVFLDDIVFEFETNGTRLIYPATVLPNLSS